MITQNGTFAAKADGAVVLGVSSKKKTPFVEYYFLITKGDHAGDRVRYTGYFTPKTEERTIESLQRCGWKGDDLGDFADGCLHGLDTHEVEIVVEMEEYESSSGESKEAPRVAWVNRLGGFLNVESAMPAVAAAAFGEKMKGLVLKMKSKAKTEPATDHSKDAPF